MAWETVWLTGAPVAGIALLAASMLPARRRVKAPRPSARAWYTRLDPAAVQPSVAQRMALVTSLAGVRAAWAGDLLREAYAAEPDAHVRGRIVRVLVSGDHFEDPAVFAAALAAGGSDAAAVSSALEPRLAALPWAVELLVWQCPGGAATAAQGRPMPQR